MTPWISGFWPDFLPQQNLPTSTLLRKSSLLNQAMVRPSSAGCILWAAETTSFASLRLPRLLFVSSVSVNFELCSKQYIKSTKLKTSHDDATAPNPVILTPTSIYPSPTHPNSQSSYPNTLIAPTSLLTIRSKQEKDDSRSSNFNPRYFQAYNDRLDENTNITKLKDLTNRGPGQDDYYDSR